MFTTLIEPADLAAHLSDPAWVVLDARFDLQAPTKGEALYRESHIPGARYVSLDAHLSTHPTGANGRHPLPSPEVAAATFGALGVSPDAQVVAYDADMGMFAACPFRASFNACVSIRSFSCVEVPCKLT